MNISTARSSFITTWKSVFTNADLIQAPLEQIKKLKALTLDNMRIILQKEVIQILGYKSRHASICQGWKKLEKTNTEIEIQVLIIKQIKDTYIKIKP